MVSRGETKWEGRGLFTIHCLPFTVSEGGVAERFKAPVLKTGVHSVDREFESRPLRHQKG